MKQVKRFSLISLTMIGLALASLYITLIYNENEDNYINNADFQNLGELEYFLHSNLVINESTIDDVLLFLENQELSCNAGREFTYCELPISNPAFYGVRTLPGQILDTGWTLIMVVKPHVLVRFWYNEQVLEEIEVELYRAGI